MLPEVGIILFKAKVPGSDGDIYAEGALRNLAQEHPDYLRFDEETKYLWARVNMIIPREALSSFDDSAAEEEMKMDIIAIVKGIFDEMRAGDFCGCYEGDLDGSYPYGVEEFLKRLRAKLDNESSATEGD